MKRLLSYLLITVMMLGVLAGCETAPKQVEEYTFPDAEYAVNATDMAVVGDKIYYIAGEKVYETASDAVVFEKFPAEFISSNGTELAIYGNGQVWCGEKTYTIPQTEIGSFVYADETFCWSYQNDDLPQIGFYNIKSGETISVYPPTGVECKLMPYQGAKILVLCYEISGTTYLYDFGIMACMAKLPEQYADILRLKIVYHLDDSGIAKVLAIKPQNARTRLSRARAALIRIIKEEGLL